jgi:type II secretory pathway component PulC
MRIPPSFWQSLLVMTAAMGLCLTPACKPSVKPSTGPAKTVAAKTNSVAAPTNQLSAEYVSVFVDLPPPKGKDPFFPNSHRRDPAAPVLAVADKPPPASELKLKGIVGSANHRLAVIGGGGNTAILEVGESGSVKVSGGKVRVTCLEIGEDFTVVHVDGEIQPKRLPLDKKGF